MFLTIVVGVLVGFTVLKTDNNEKIERILIDEFVPATVKENTVSTSTVKFIDRGTMRVSWYGPKFHGKMTANGEVYDQMAFTAAHKNLAFGTLLKVTNPKNGRTVIVRINDRGPYVEGRDLDLSKGAAIELGILRRGVARLKIQEVALTVAGTQTALIN